MTAYIKRLKQEFDDRGSASAGDTAPDLKQRFLDWYTALPSITRSRAFAMSEFEAATGSQGKYLSKILIDLGWTRGRRWSGQGQFARFWLPPRGHRMNTTYDQR